MARRAGRRRAFDRSLTAQGAARIIVCTDGPHRYAKPDRRDPLAAGVVV